MSHFSIQLGFAKNEFALYVTFNQILLFEYLSQATQFLANNCNEIRTNQFYFKEYVQWVASYFLVNQIKLNICCKIYICLQENFLLRSRIEEADNQIKIIQLRVWYNNKKRHYDV